MKKVMNFTLNDVKTQNPNLTEDKNISLDKDHIRIGSACTFTEIKDNWIIPCYFKTAIQEMASSSIRNLATIGENICNASPTGEILPLLYTVNAVVVLANREGERKVPIEKFILGPGKIDIRKDELLKEVLIPWFGFNKSFYKKVGTGKEAALSKVSFIGFVHIGRGKKIKDIRMAFGDAGQTIVRSKELENRLIGLTTSEIKNNILQIKEEYSNIIKPIDDQRSSAAYRKKLSLKLLEYFLLKYIS